MLRLALCQANLPVGDLAGNVERIRHGIRQAGTAGPTSSSFPSSR